MNMLKRQPSLCTFFESILRTTFKQEKKKKFPKQKRLKMEKKKKEITRLFETDEEVVKV